MNRREVIVGSAAAIVATQIPSALAASSYEEDLMRVCSSCISKFEKAEYITDWLYIFQNEMTILLKKWGSWEPLREVMLVDTTTGTRRPFGNYMYDPNFFDGSTFGGSFVLSGKHVNLNGFTQSFRFPDGCTVKVRYHHDGRKFDIKLLTSTA